MDEELRRLERLAQMGDPEAQQRLLAFKLRAGIRVPPKIKPGLQTQEVELDFAITIDEIPYDLTVMMVECHYAVDGADAPATRWDPGSSASWLLYHVVLLDQDQIDHYNEEALREGQPFLPFDEGDDIYSSLTSQQQQRIEDQLEGYDREPGDYYDEPDDWDYGPDDY